MTDDTLSAEHSVHLTYLGDRHNVYNVRQSHDPNLGPVCVEVMGQGFSFTEYLSAEDAGRLADALRAEAGVPGCPVHSGVKP